MRSRLALLSCWLLLTCLVGCARQLSLQEWKATIEKELPVGTRRAEVERFLDAHQIAHKFMDTSRFAGEPDRVAAYISSTDSTSHRAGIELTFRFDSNQQLISYDAREIFVGP